MDLKQKQWTRLWWLLSLPIVMAVMACAGASAPPLSIPAPVTGRITVSSPDESGQLTVIGEDNAVSADALVLAINTSNSVATLRFLSQLVPTAYAQVFPGRCSELGNACALSDANGAFEISIAGDEDDEIEIVIIDATTGNDRSNRINKTVPANFLHFAFTPIDVAVDSIGGFMYVLLDDTSDSTTNSRVSRVDLTTGERVATNIGGVSPQRLIFDSDVNILTALDQAGEFATIADLSGGSFGAATTVNLPAPPIDAALDVNGFELWVTLEDETNAIAILDTMNGVVSEILAAPAATGLTHVRAVSADLRNIAGTEVMAVVSQFTRFVDSATIWGITFYDIASRTIDSGPTLISDAGLISDVAFVQNDNFLLVDATANAIFDFTMTGASEVSNLPEVTATPSEVITEPVQVVVVQDQALAFVTARNGNTDRPDTVLSIDLGSLTVIDVTPVGLRPSRMVWDDSLLQLFVVSRISRSVTRLPLSALRPGNADLF